MLYCKIHCNIAGPQWGSVDETILLLLYYYFGQKYSTNPHGLLKLIPYGKMYSAHTSCNYPDVMSCKNLSDRLKKLL